MRKDKLKLIGILLLVFALIIIGFQNTDEVSTKILFFSVTMPRVILLLVTALFGFALGVLVSLHVTGHTGERRQKHTGPPGEVEPKVRRNR